MLNEVLRHLKREMIEGNILSLEKRKQCRFGVAEILGRREKLPFSFQEHHV